MGGVSEAITHTRRTFSISFSRLWASPERDRVSELPGWNSAELRPFPSFVPPSLAFGASSMRIFNVQRFADSPRVSNPVGRAGGVDGSMNRGGNLSRFRSVGLFLHLLLVCPF